MSYQSGILLGQITKLSGFEGTVAVRLEKIFFGNIPEMESLFLEIDGRMVPFFVSDFEYSGADILRLKFEGYNSVEKINEFVSCRVFLTTSAQSKKECNDFQSLNGFHVFNQENELLGEIKEVIPNPAQLLLRVTSGGKKEILIPFHEHLILSINKRKKVIVMSIPEGLIEINCKN